MGTRSAIGVVREDGKVEAIYCHWDGYPSHQIPKLACYKTLEQVKALIALGDLSSLGEEIGEQHEWAKHHENPKAKKWCCAYYRDRNEKRDGKRVFANKESMQHTMDNCGCQYFYVFENGGWRYAAGDSDCFHSINDWLEANPPKEAKASA